MHVFGLKNNNWENLWVLYSHFDNASLNCCAWLTQNDASIAPFCLEVNVGLFQKARNDELTSL